MQGRVEAGWRRVGGGLDEARGNERAYQVLDLRDAVGFGVVVEGGAEARWVV